jgi:3-dehydroquinate synthase
LLDRIFSEMTASKATTLSLQLEVAERSARSEILMGRGLLNDLPALLAPSGDRKLILVSDDNVAACYAVAIRDGLEAHGFRAHLLTVRPGESAKSIATLIELCKMCKELSVDRDDAVIAIGGGMVGDLAGMLASVFLRGLEFVQVPTSLVAMVSASVGGKVGVNFLEYKNLLGAFKQPSMVIADTAALETLPATEFLSGLGELVTVGVLGEPEIFEALEARGATDLDPLIWSAIGCKKRIVEADPLDRFGVRAKLNLGHTFGHALERLSDFELAHGLAVSVGLRLASQLAAELRLCSPSIPSRIRRTLTGLGLPVTLRGFQPDRMIEAMRADKKVSGGMLRWVLPVEIGDVALVSEQDVPVPLLESLLREIVMEGEG